MSNGAVVKPNGGGSTPPPRELLTAEEAARFLARFIEGTDKPSASAIHKMKHRGQFNGFGVIVQDGRNVRYAISGLRKYIAAHTVL